MEKPGRYKIDDKMVKDTFDHVFQNALGSPVVLDSAPGVDDVKPDTPAFHGTNLYIKMKNGELYRFSGVKVT